MSGSDLLCFSASSMGAWVTMRSRAAVVGKELHFYCGIVMAWPFSAKTFQIDPRS